MKLDTLNRRSRFERHSTDKPVKPTELSLLWFEKLQLHGPLPTPYLIEYAKLLVGYTDAYHLSKVLRDLHHEENTPHGGAYLDRPYQQKLTDNPLANNLVHDINHRSRLALAEEGKYRDLVRDGSFKHQLLSACITASIELGCLRQPSVYHYVSRFEIEDRANVKLDIPVTFTDPNTTQRITRRLKPDDIFLIEYKDTKAFRLFVVEADRATEPNETPMFDRKSFLRNALQYAEFIGKGLYKQHFDTVSPMLLLTVTINPTKMQHMMDVVLNVSKGKGSNFMLFQFLPMFGLSFKPPAILPELFNSPWHRAGHHPFYINRP